MSLVLVLVRLSPIISDVVRYIHGASERNLYFPYGLCGLKLVPYSERKPDINRRAPAIEILLIQEDHEEFVPYMPRAYVNTCIFGRGTLAELQVKITKRWMLLYLYLNLRYGREFPLHESRDHASQITAETRR
jgi:hypothetical protein